MLLVCLTCLGGTIGCGWFFEELFGGDNGNRSGKSSLTLPPTHGNSPPPPEMPRVSMDGRGGGMAVWNGNGAVVARSYDPSGGWGPEQIVSTSADQTPEVAVALNGSRGVAIWEQGRNIWSTLFDASTGWESNAELRELALDPAMTPSLASNTFGGGSTIHTAWKQVFTSSSSSQHGGVAAENFRFDTGWSGWSRVDTNPQQLASAQTIFGLRTAAGGQGRAVAVWFQTVAVGSQYVPGIVAARRTTNHWEPAERIGFGSAEAQNPDVAMDLAGNALAVWEQDGDLYASTYSQAVGAWSTPDVLRAVISTETSFRPRVAMNGDGVAIVVCAASDGGVYTAYYSVQSGWDVHQRVDVLSTGWIGVPGENPEPRVAVDADGNGRAVWKAGGEIYSCRFDGATMAWEPAESIGTGRDPDLAMDKTGRAIAVWWDQGFREKVWPPPGNGEILFAGNLAGQFDIFSLSPDYTVVIQLTTSPADDLDPVWSPNRDRIAFVSDRDNPVTGGFDLYVLEIATGTVNRLTYYGDDGLTVRDPAWLQSTVEDRLAFSWGPPSPGFGGVGGIEILDLDTGASLGVTSGPSQDRWPTWSEDGSEIAFGARWANSGRGLAPGLFPGPAGPPRNLGRCRGAGVVSRRSPDCLRRQGRRRRDPRSHSRHRPGRSADEPDGRRLPRVVALGGPNRLSGRHRPRPEHLRHDR